MNNVNLIGRIAVDNKVVSGVVSTLLAVKRIYHSKDGIDTDFIPLSIFGKQADNFSKMVSKGQQIGVDGRLKTSEYADQNGEKKYGWSVAVDHFYLIGSGKHEHKGHTSQDENTYKIDSQLSNLDKILDQVKTDEQADKQEAKQPTDNTPAESISPIPPLGNGSKNNRSHISGNDFSQQVIDSQPTIEQLEQEIKDLKSKAVPF